MFPDDTRNILENIINGIVLPGKKDHLTAARNFLCSGFSTNKTVEKNFERQSAIKEEQSKTLNTFITEQNLWLQNFPSEERYLTKGGEASVYFDNDNRSVIKLNDAVYYNTWLDFFNSVLIHNTFFAETAYELLGFTESEHGLLAVLKQPFIIADNEIDLTAVKNLLEYNGFKNTKRNDYYNEELGLILEDIHDENVIVNSNTLFFIDTVFYIHLSDINKRQ
jgi:Serine/Threonine/Tyrosine Kinase found in polyvalent proteins